MAPRTKRVSILAGATVLLAAITWIDYLTGYEFGFFIFYFIPVSLVAWYGSGRGGVAFACLAGACWYLSDRLSPPHYSNALLIYWETFMRLVSFLTTAVTLSHIRSDLRQREDVLHVVSHDLRSPLAALVGQAEVLRKRIGGDGYATARIDAILRCASRMDAMIEDLVDSARNASNRLELQLSPVEVGAYLAELLDRSGSQLETGRVRLLVEDGARLFARADPSRLDRIVVNLLSNALKYSPSGSPVELGVATGGDWVTISVSDHGPGIPGEDLPHVFDRFYRGKRTAARGGLGIGLYSVRMLVAAHGGAVTVEPGCLGGTTFRVALPASPAPGPPRRAQGVREAGG
jgi:signal transduction histidine kinase